MTKTASTETAAYNYRAQRWITGPEAKLLHRQQLREELAILESPRGQEYCDMIRLVNRPPIVLADQIQRIRTALEGKS